MLGQGSYHFVRGCATYVVFLPDTPQTTQGRILAMKEQLRIIPSITANQLDASVKKMGKGLLGQLAVADRKG